MTRTYLSVLVARLDGRIVRDLVSGIAVGLREVTDSLTGLSKRERLPPWPGVVVCPGTSQYIYELYGG